MHKRPAAQLLRCVIIVLAAVNAVAAPGPTVSTREVHPQVSAPTASRPPSTSLVSHKAEISRKGPRTGASAPGININIAETTGPAMAHLREHYATLPQEDLQMEISRLETAQARLSHDSREFQDLDDLIASMRMKLQFGVTPQQVLEELTSQVATIRKLPIKQPLRFRIIERDQLRKLIEDKLVQELAPTYLPNYEFVLKLLGAIEPHDDLRKLIVSLLSEQVAGMYDKDTRILYVMRDFDLNRSLSRIILSHEICHALQDQNFNLAKLPLNDPDNDDLNMAVSSVLEGDATMLMTDFVQKAFSGKDLAQLVDLLMIDQGALNKSPYFLRQQLMFPYLEGQNFVLRQSLISPANRDRIFVNYPISTEQIMHSEKYSGALRDDPTTFSIQDFSPRLGQGWHLAFKNVFGEMQMKTLFESWREWDAAKEVAEGWDGDRYYLYRNGPEYLLLWASVWDADNDAKEYCDHFSALLREKCYREQFGSAQYEEADGARFFSGVSKDTSETLRIRIKQSGKQAVFLLSNSDKAMDTACELEPKFFDALKGNEVVLVEPPPDADLEICAFDPVTSAP